MFGFAPVVTGDETSPTKADYLIAKAIEQPDAQQQKSIDIYESNRTAFSVLLMSIQTKTECGKTAFATVGTVVNSICYNGYGGKQHLLQWVRW